MQTIDGIDRDGTMGADVTDGRTTNRLAAEILGNRDPSTYSLRHQTSRRTHGHSGMDCETKGRP
jgi:hypothetical protein